MSDEILCHKLKKDTKLSMKRLSCLRVGVSHDNFDFVILN